MESGKMFENPAIKKAFDTAALVVAARDSVRGTTEYSRYLNGAVVRIAEILWEEEEIPAEIRENLASVPFYDCAEEYVGDPVLQQEILSKMDKLGKALDMGEMTQALAQGDFSMTGRSTRLLGAAATIALSEVWRTSQDYTLSPGEEKHYREVYQKMSDTTPRDDLPRNLAEKRDAALAIILK